MKKGFISNISRREFVRGIATGLAALNLLDVNEVFAATSEKMEVKTMSTGIFELPALPYPQDALSPYISANTIGFHYRKHHQAYVDNLNKLVKDTPFATKKIEEIIKETSGKQEHPGIFNNAAQVWNHTFYWKSMNPKVQKPSEKMKKLIEASFGNIESMEKEFLTASLGQFGSGWSWLVFDEGKLKIMKTSNADNPLTQGKAPLLTIDVWEHAYYLDYQNKRGDYVKAVMANLLDWGYAEANLPKK